MEIQLHTTNRVSLSDYMCKNKDERQAHLDLSQPCLEIGSNSQGARALLAVLLNTTAEGLGKGNGYLCHACHNAKCSNPYHHYFGTPSENVVDMYEDQPNMGKKIRDTLLAKNPNHYRDIAKNRTEVIPHNKFTEEQVKERLDQISHLDPTKWGFRKEIAAVWGVSPQVAGRFYKKYGHVV